MLLKEMCSLVFFLFGCVVCGVGGGGGGVGVGWCSMEHDGALHL